MRLATISAPGLNTFTKVDASARSDGRFVVCWEEQTRGLLNTFPNAILSDGVYIESFAANGRPTASPVLLSSLTGTGFSLQQDVSVTSSLNGTLVASLSAPDPLADANQIVIDFLDDTLASTAAPVRITAPGLNTFTKLDASAQSDGGFVVCWEEQTRGPANGFPNAILSDGVYIQRFAANGQSVMGPVLLSSVTGTGFSLQQDVSVASSSNGTLVASLSAPDSLADANQIVIDFLDDTLASTAAPVRITAPGLNTFTKVDASVQSDGGFVVSWEEQTRRPLSSSPNAIVLDGVYMQRFAANGHPITNPILLSSVTGTGFSLQQDVGVARTLNGTLTAFFSAPAAVADANQIVINFRDDNAPAVNPVETGTLQGSHDQYVVACDTRSLVVQDLVVGRDGNQTFPATSVITFTDGFGVIDPTGTAENVTRIYQALLQRVPDVTGLQYWAALVDNAHVPLAMVASSFAASPEFLQTYGSLSDDSFIQKLYQNALGRPAEAAGEQAWDDALASGITRGEVALGFAESPENRVKTNSISGDKNDAEAYRLYQASLARIPDQAGQLFWSSVLANGATPSQIAQAFIGSAEFQQKYGGLSTQSFVSTLYQNALNRAPDAGGLQAWISALQGGMSKADVVVSFSDSLENRLNTASVTHDGWVFIHG